MVEVLRTAEFDEWLRGLRDMEARGAILKRIVRLRRGNAGDVEPVGRGVSELRIHVGAGYRVYYAQRGDTLVLLLCGGNKRTQQKDIRRAIALAQAWR